MMERMQKMTLQEIIKFYENDSTFLWGIVNRSNLNALYNNDYIIRIFKKYASWTFYSLEDTADAIKEDFKNVWYEWCYSNYDSFKKLVDAWNSDYNALDNYDRTETGTIINAHHKGSKQATNIDSSTTDANKSTDSISAFNDGLTPVSETAGTADNNVSHTTANVNSNYTTITDISADVYDKDVTEYNNYRVRGNIGVMTPADSIEKEKNLRLKDLAYYIVASFIKENCYYVC